MTPEIQKACDDFDTNLGPDIVQVIVLCYEVQDATGKMIPRIEVVSPLPEPLCQATLLVAIQSLGAIAAARDEQEKQKARKGN